MAKTAPRKQVLDHLFCHACGTQARVKTKGFSGDVIPTCANCGRKVIDALTLLVSLDLVGEEARVCPSCKITTLNHAFCYACGQQLGSDEQVARLAPKKAKAAKDAPSTEGAAAG